MIAKGVAPSIRRRILRSDVAVLLAVGFIAGCSGSSTPPVVNPAVTISGAGQARLGTTVQLTATVTNTTNTAVTWLVNGTAGGSSTTGTVSVSGLYTPPTAIPNPNTVTITASTQATPVATSAPLTESILNPIPVVTSAQATETTPGATSYSVDLIGTGFISSSQVQVNGVSVPVTLVSSTELLSSGTITLAAGATTAAVTVMNPDPGTMTATATANVVNLKATLQASARLLDQATFGPTLNDISHVQAVGVNAYLGEQFAVPATHLPDIATPPPTVCANSLLPCEQSEWWQTMLTAPDQLRQRVAFALSEIFVVSTNSVNARSVTTYQNMLANDAFGNFYTIMQDVSLSPAMGAYLNMLNSAKPATGQIANENYPRELMQLFTTGIDMLNQDGSLQLDGSGNPIPVYTETLVQAFARAYTGWTYGNASGTGAATKFPQAANYTAPMAAYEAQHDMTSKILLNGTTLPAGQSTNQDLAGALTNIFNHQNVGPFVCRQLIQHLVASNPSPAYVSRVAAVFANDGTGQRGDMKAVITAILTDADARAGDTSPNFDGGHLREPMLYMTNVMRGLGYVNNDAKAGNDVVANASYNTVGNYTAALGEKPYSSGSVFNFFPPSYVIPGTTLNAPEFGQENTASAVLRLTLANSLVGVAAGTGISGFTVDLSKTSALGMTASATGNAMTDSGNLVDSLGVIFMHGQMPTQMRTAIVNHVATLTDPAERVRVAAYLVITSSFYKVEH
ncbi:MAG: DUF1800 domain-containing protein [Edaphobacter sp.]